MRTARGTMINAAFQVGLAGLELLKRVLVAAFLTVTEFGFWGLLVVALTTLVWLKQVGINDKYIQQSEADQETAFQKAFTLELLYTLGFYVLILVALPLYALYYGRPEILVPGFVLSLAVLASAFQTPNWIWYRRMEYFRQRVLQSVDPVVTFAVTVPLAIAGLGYWSLVVGAVTGSSAAAVAAIRACPYRLRLRFDRGTLREYVSFSWPLLVVSGSNLLIVQVAVMVGEKAVGLAGVGVIGLAGAIAVFGDRVNNIVTTTIYPAVCAVRERTDLLAEAFIKSNRLALMWAVPFGLGLTLFAPDLVEFGLGEKWEPAIGVLQMFGVITAAKQVGFNWTAFMRARNDTRPMAIAGILAMVTFMAVGIPLIFVQGVTGYALGMGAVTAVQLATRSYFLNRLFAGFGFLQHAGRAMAPSVPAVAAVLLARVAEGGADRTLAIALSELLLYVVVTTAATLILERRLLREMLGYLRRVGAPVPRPAK